MAVLLARGVCIFPLSPGKVNVEVLRVRRLCYRVEAGAAVCAFVGGSGERICVG